MLRPPLQPRSRSDTWHVTIMVEGGAALPWGNAGPEAAPIERDLLSNLGLQLGGRVEVLWQVEPEEGQDAGAATTKVSSLRSLLQNQVK